MPHGRSGPLRSAFLASLAIALTPLVAHAVVYRLSFEGAVGTVTDDGAFALAGISVAPSDRFELVAEGPGDGLWNGPARIGTTVFATSFQSVVGNDRRISVELVIDELVVGPGPAPDGGNTSLLIDFISIRLVDSNATALDSDAFPDELHASNWGFRTFLISGIYPTGTDPQSGDATGPRFNISGTIAAVSYVLVPEPRSALLLACGLVLLGWRTRRGPTCSPSSRRTQGRTDRAFRP